MIGNYSKIDLKNIQEIKDFLKEYKVDYKDESDEGRFILWYNNDEKRSYEIEYVSSKSYPISYPKYEIEGVDKKFFYELSKKAEDNNSFKMWIKDYEWANENKKEILKSYILHAAQKTLYNFYARDCEVRVVDSKIGRAFEIENCFYGKRGASLSLGLFLKKDKNGLKKDEMMMIYTFGKNFFGKTEGMIEILRVGTRRYSNVVGGASKLMKHFLKNYEYIKIGKNEIKVKTLKFYSDYDHNIGNSLEKIGFDFEGYSKGGFMNYWVNSGEVKHRQPMKHKWVMNQMEIGECIAIPNAGVKRYTLKISE